MVRKLALCILLLAAISCGGEVVPYVGMWKGRFEPDPSNPVKDGDPTLDWRGYLQLYRTEDKFILHLESRSLAMELKGKWTLKEDRRILLEIGEVTFNDRGGKLLGQAGLNPIPPEKLRETYSRQLILDIGEDKKTLNGLLMHHGPLLGRLVFTKGGG